MLYICCTSPNPTLCCTDDSPPPQTEPRSHSPPPRPPPASRAYNALMRRKLGLLVPDQEGPGDEVLAAELLQVSAVVGQRAAHGAFCVLHPFHAPPIAWHHVSCPRRVTHACPVHLQHHMRACCKG